MKIANIKKLLVLFVGISGCFSVLFGAWLAHAGQALPIEQQTRLATAHQYQLIHTLALLAVLVWYQIKPVKALLLSACLFVIGILFFSGSLYLKTLFLIGLFAKVTPLGGIAMALGWLCLVFVGEKKS